MHDEGRMTDGITEAMRDTVEALPSKRRRWLVAVDRHDDMERNFEVDAVDASSAFQSAFIRGALEGVEVTSVTIREL